MIDLVRVFGHNLKRLRKSYGWTQERLAERLEVHVSYIGLLERGSRSPSLETAERAAKVFGLPGFEFFIDATVPDRRQQVSIEQLVELVRTAAPERRAVLYAAAKRLLEAKGREKG